MSKIDYDELPLSHLPAKATKDLDGFTDAIAAMLEDALGHRPSKTEMVAGMTEFVRMFSEGHTVASEGRWREWIRRTEIAIKATP